MRFKEFVKQNEVINESGYEDRFEYVSNTLKNAIETMMDEDEFVGKANSRQLQKLNTLLNQTFEKWAEEVEDELKEIDKQEPQGEE